MDNYVAQWPAGVPDEGWRGPVSDIAHTGLRMWRGTWHNSKGETHHFDISLLDDSIIRLDEEESHQRWEGPYERQGNWYEFAGRGTGNDQRFEFAGTLELVE